MKTAIRAGIGGREMSFSNLDKVLWPADGYTKGDIIRYYAEIAPFLLPHLHDRPLVFTRYPDGIEGKFFYQKNAPEYLPEWIPTYPWHSQDNTQNDLILAEETATLAWLANQAYLEIHPWLSRKDSILNPDFIVFDLDPYDDSHFHQVVEVALVIKQQLDDMGLRSYVKTSGATGLHIFLPIINKYTYTQVRAWALKVAGIVCSTMPDRATTERSLKERGKRIYIDCMQNAAGKTLCAPYCVRARNGAPVSTPLKWEELKDVFPSQFNIRSIFDRLKKTGDLFHPVLNDQQDLDRVMGMLV